MKAHWLVTPYFLDEHDPALAGAVPDGVSRDINEPGNLGGRSAKNLMQTHGPIADFTEVRARSRELPVSIAGDCVASLPVMAGLQRTGLDPVLVWLDAHGDFNTTETSPSGFLGGMPLAMMVGRGDLSIPHQVGQIPVAEDDVWLVGARDLDPGEKYALEASSVHRAQVDDIAELVFERPVHLHIDNDVIDASDVPANNYPVAGGPGLAQTIGSSAAFVSRNRICAISLSGWNGKLDSNGQTSRACRDLLTAIIGAEEDKT